MKQIYKLTMDEAWKIAMDNEKLIRTKMMNRVRQDLKDDCIQHIYSQLPAIWSRYNPEVTSFRNFYIRTAHFLILNLCNDTTKLAKRVTVYNFDDKGIKVYAEKDEKFVYEMPEYFSFEEYMEDHYSADIDIVDIVAGMTLRHRVVFVLKDILGYSYQQIAEILGIAKTGVMLIAKEIRKEINEIH